MPTVFYVPGFSASELFEDPSLTRLLWVDLGRILLSSPGKLRLHPDGQRPGPPDGAPLFVGKSLPPYADAVLYQLRSAPALEGWQVEDWGWDWRKDIYAAGVLLSARIRTVATVADPCTIVGHSSGGLVARAAWRVLELAGNHGLIRRIVTVGTPHLGTYFAVATFSGLGEFVNQIVQAGAIAGGGLFLPSAAFLAYFTVPQMANIALTFPCLYQLLPLLNAVDVGGDPHRARLYSATRWGGLAVDIDPNHLAAVLTGRDAWLTSVESHPPAGVLFAVAGRGYSTPAQLAEPDLLGQPEALGYTDAGDGVVTVASALADWPSTMQFACAHADLPTALAESGLLVHLVVDGGLPTPTAEPARRQFGGPPLASLSLDPFVGGVCPSGNCSC